MLLTLNVPQINRMVLGGVIHKWYVAEGESVSYGQPILDIKVDRVAVTKPWRVSGKIRQVAMREHQSLEEIARSLEGADPSEFAREKRSDFLMRVTSSDFGKLLRVNAKEGDTCTVGESVAVLGTEDDEVVTDDDLTAASQFRAVASIIESSIRGNYDPD